MRRQNSNVKLEPLKKVGFKEDAPLTGPGTASPSSGQAIKKKTNLTKATMKRMAALKSIYKEKEKAN